MNIQNTIKIDNYTFKNYIILNKEEKILALEFRNSNKEWMINQNIIPLDEHLNWIETLNNNQKTIYFLVFKDNIPFMSIDYHDININKKEAYWGYFLGNQNYKSEVLKIEKLIIDIAFKQLKLNKLLCISDINNKVTKIHEFFGFKVDKKVTIENREFILMFLEKSDK